MPEVVLTLPEELVEAAKANGLLNPKPLEALLRAEIRRRRINKLFAAADRLANSQEPLSEAELEVEIMAVRSVRKTPDADCS